MADYKALAQTIVDNVGGANNVRALTHCVTRLRFTLKNPKLTKTDVPEKTDGVIKVIEAGGQYQVVVGAKVTGLYEEILADFDVQGAGAVEPAPAEADGDAKNNAVNRLMGTMSAILMPTLPVLTAAGIIKGLVALFAALGILSTTDGIYMVFYAVHCNEFIGATIGAALVYPSMVNIATTLPVAGSLFAGTPFQMDFYNTFFGIPIVMPGSGYTSPVVPIMIASILEHAFRKHLNEMVRDLLTPLFVLAISVPVTYLVMAPSSRASAA